MNRDTYIFGGTKKNLKNNFDLACNLITFLWGVYLESVRTFRFQGCQEVLPLDSQNKQRYIKFKSKYQLCFNFPMLVYNEHVIEGN